MWLVFCEIMNFDFLKENYSDDDLVSLIKRGDHKYLQQLIVRYMPYVLKSVEKYNFRPDDKDDVVQDALMAIYSAVNGYDEGKASFKTFVCVCIDRAIISNLRRANSSKRIPENLISSIEDVDSPVSKSAESIVIELENRCSLGDMIKNELSSFEYEVFYEYIDGSSYGDIAKKLSVDIKSVDNALSRIRSKLRNKAY